jgi:hypothetical protein
MGRIYLSLTSKMAFSTICKWQFSEMGYETTQEQGPSLAKVMITNLEGLFHPSGNT